MGENEYKKGLWTAEEDKILIDYIREHGQGRWNRISKTTGLKRFGKSCRLRWMNYLRPGVNRGNFTEDEDDLIIRLHNLLGNRWSLIAGRVPGRTDNQVKNHWNSHLSKKLMMKKDEENTSESSKSLPHEGLGENLHLLQEARNSNTNSHPSFSAICGEMGPQSKDCPERTASALDLSSSFWFSNDDFYLNNPGLMDLLDAYPLDGVWRNL
ncbi:hypothetical protein MRB53_031514 [Persea americana]|uniref:Uncharacterized protein n=1 Tax=Persea americana TaxID=3435 RepID=A0ACC2KPQ2_PERAE|nr:hypothetical protein MRB53_031514 [Persea americana]